MKNSSKFIMYSLLSISIIAGCAGTRITTQGKDERELAGLWYLKTETVSIRNVKGYALVDSMYVFVDINYQKVIDNIAAKDIDMGTWHTSNDTIYFKHGQANDINTRIKEDAILQELIEKENIDLYLKGDTQFKFDLTRGNLRTLKFSGDTKNELYQELKYDFTPSEIGKIFTKIVQTY